MEVARKICIELVTSMAFGLAWLEKLASVWTGTSRDALHFLQKW